MMRTSMFRLSPLLLLAAMLMALAVLFAPGAQPAQAQTTTVWSRHADRPALHHRHSRLQ